VVGKVSLGQRATLHYVRTGGRILVIGVAQNSVTPIAEFEEDAFDTVLADAPRTAGAPSTQGGFLEALGAATGKGKGKAESSTPPEDDDLTQLRSDLQRLRHYLQEGGRDRES
jgi:flagellar biogenesis protein FliO